VQPASVLHNLARYCAQVACPNSVRQGISFIRLAEKATNGLLPLVTRAKVVNCSVGGLLRFTGVLV